MEMLANAVRPKKKKKKGNKRNTYWQKERNLSLLIDDITAYLQNLKEPTMKKSCGDNR